MSKPGYGAVGEEPKSREKQRIDVNAQDGNMAAGIALQLVIFFWFADPLEENAEDGTWTLWGER